MITVRQNYTTVLGFECLNSCIYNHIFNIGCSIDKSDIYFIGDGIRFSKKASINPLRIATNMYESNFAFLKKANIYFKYEKAKGKQEAIALLLESIKSGSFLCIRVGTELLVHNPVFQHVINTPHFINPIGVDLNNDLIYISDGYIPSQHSTTFEGWTDFTAILNAWQSMDYCYMLLYSLDKLAENESTIKKVAKQRFKNAIAQYINNYDKENKNQFSVNKLLNYLMSSFYRNQHDSFNELILKINYQLKVDGFLTAKRYVLDFMGSYKEYENYFNKYQEIEKAWGHIDKHLIKIGITNEGKHLHDFINKVQDLCESENEIFKTIIEF